MLGDGDLVLAARSGDQAAFATIYDRYADRLHDFCHSVLRDRHEAADAMQDTFVLAARRLGQLREPDKLRPWLYSIARHESLRRAKLRKRAVPTEDTGTDVASPAASPEDVVSGQDAGAIVWEAATGLSERDRVLLDLHLRQGLDGQDLADAIGTTPGHAYVLMNRLREQVERSIGALLVARLGRDECTELRRVLEGWDGRFSPLWRKRVARHVDDCDVCTKARKVLTSPLALLAAAPLVPAPLALRERTLDRLRNISDVHPAGTWRRPGARHGFPPPLFPPRCRRRILAAVAAGALVLGGGLAVVEWTDGRGGGAESDVAVPARDDDRGASTSTSTTPTTIAAVTEPEAVTTTTRRVTPVVPPPPPDTLGPAITLSQAYSCRIAFSGNENTLMAAVTDPSGVNAVTVAATHTTQGTVVSGPMYGTMPSYERSVKPPGGAWQFPGTVTWTVTATDTLGYTASASSAFTIKTNCT